MIEALPLKAWPFQPILSILIFHRVLQVRDPLRPGEPSVQDFERFISYLSRNFNVLPLCEAVALLREERLPRRSCSITFDDGYADNLANALPILEKYHLPATVFIATGYLDGGRMFNDDVIDAIAQTRGQSLDLHGLDLGVRDVATAQGKQLAIDAILQRLKCQPPEQRSKVVATLLELTECDTLPNDIMLTSEQVFELSSRGIEIGGHTVNHPILTSLEDDMAYSEIAVGKQNLEKIIGKPVRSFAYPNGKPHQDYAARHVAMVKELGFDLAVSTAHGVGSSKCDMHQLPRFTPWGYSALKWSGMMLRNALAGKLTMTC